MAKLKAPKKRGQKESPKFEVNRAALPCLVIVILAIVIVGVVMYFALQGGSSS